MREDPRVQPGAPALERPGTRQTLGATEVQVRYLKGEQIRAVWGGRSTLGSRAAYPGFPFFLRSLMGSRALNGLRWVPGCL